MRGGSWFTGLIRASDPPQNRFMSDPVLGLALPTYNEAGNIEAIVEAARDNLPDRAGS